jgi:hypothetical protein
MKESRMSAPDELTQLIAQRLEIDWQYVEHVESWNTDRVAEIRSAGRKAGRLLGYKIVTHQSQPEQREDGRVVVIVAVRESPNEEDQERLKERSMLLLEDSYRRNMDRSE